MKTKVSLVFATAISLMIFGCTSAGSPVGDAVSATPTAEVVIIALADETFASIAGPTQAPAPTAPPAEIPSSLDPDGLVSQLDTMTVEAIKVSGEYLASPADESGIVTYSRTTQLLGKDGMASILFDAQNRPLGVIYSVTEASDTADSDAQTAFYMSLRTQLENAFGAPNESTLTDIDTGEAIEGYTTEDIQSAIAGDKQIDCMDGWVRKAGVYIVSGLTADMNGTDYILAFGNDAFWAMTVAA